MATLIELCESTELIRIDPLEENELSWRTLLATNEFVGWLDGELPGLGHNNLYSDLTPLEQVFAVFIEYTIGEKFSEDRRFKKLSCNPDHCIWEIKTDEVRIFGWVPQKDIFICCFGDSKDRIVVESSYGKYIAQTAYVRSKITLDEPKYLKSGKYEDVLSTKS